jgi:hypothetical protein
MQNLKKNKSRGSTMLPAGLTINIGIHNRYKKDKWVQTRSASRLFVHEKFSIDTIAYDIALIRLKVFIL